MKKFISSIYEFMTLDNSHEEDGEPYEYQYESASDRVLGKIALAVIVLILVVSVF